MENKTDDNPSVPMTPEELANLVDNADKSVTMSLTGEDYAVFYKGKTPETVLTLGETIKMWAHMTDWLLVRAGEMTLPDAENVRKQVLSTLASKITFEYNAEMEKEQAEKSSIITL
jgi:hypothetical protein